jgi:hypothetical protein
MAKISRQRFIAVFERLMAENGTSVQRIPEERRAAVYRLPDGKTVRLFTNNKPVLMVAKYWSDHLGFERNDLVGISYALDGKTRVFLVPTENVVRAMRDQHQQWLAESPSHDPNRAPILKFSGRHNNYAEKWHQYLIGEIGAEAATPSETGILAIAARARREIAAALEVDESAVHITVDASGKGDLLFRL